MDKHQVEELYAKEMRQPKIIIQYGKKYERQRSLDVVAHLTRLVSSLQKTKTPYRYKFGDSGAVAFYSKEKGSEPESSELKI